MDDVPGRKVLAGVLVQGLVELTDQFLEDRPHGRVVDPVGVQIHVLEALQHLEQQPGLLELADGVVEVEALQHVAHVLAEVGDVVPEVCRDLRRVGQQLVEVEARGVVEGEARGGAKRPVHVLQSALAQLRLPLQHGLLGFC